MTREQKIIMGFVNLANVLVQDFDVVELLHDLVERTVELLDCDQAGLLLADSAGVPRVVASSQRADLLELLQHESREGPCYECLMRGESVWSEDIEREAERWPHYAPAALEAGIRSACAVPVRVQAATVGALNLLRTKAGPMAADDLPLIQGMADFAAIVLLQQRSTREARVVIQGLESALNSRVTIEQAKGVLAAQAGIDVEAAFARLRRHARHNNLKLNDVAHSLLDGTLPASAFEEHRLPRGLKNSNNARSSYS